MNLTDLVAVSVVGGWTVAVAVWVISVCDRKGKRRFAALGLAGLVVPGLWLFALVGAMRVARPSSIWALQRYGPEMMDQARDRYRREGAFSYFGGLRRVSDGVGTLVVLLLAASVVVVIVLPWALEGVAVATWLIAVLAAACFLVAMAVEIEFSGGRVQRGSVPRTERRIPVSSGTPR
jgi:hypothetical protein